MLKQIIKHRLAAFERKYGYDTSYAREILAADTGAFLKFARFGGISGYRKDAPVDMYWAAKLVGTIAEDCGPCTQLVVSMALEAGADPKIIAAVLANDEAAMGDHARLGVRFARTAIAHDPEADTHRETIAKQYGPRAVLSVAFAVCAGRFYPTLKYALGHGKTCQRVKVGTEHVVVAHAT